MGFSNLADTRWMDGWMRTFLEYGRPVNLEDCLFAILVLLGIAHGGGGG